MHNWTVFFMQKSFENIVGEEEKAGNQLFLNFQKVFSALLRIANSI